MDPTDRTPKHVCTACGKQFLTLSRLRFHETEECPNRELEEIGDDEQDQGDRMSEDLLTCRSCGRTNPEDAYDPTPSLSNGDYHLIVEFTCRYCQFENDNRLVMEDINIEDVALLPHHLQPTDEQRDDL